MNSEQSFQPLFVRTNTIRHAAGSVAFDCVKIIFVRKGSAILYGEFGHRPINVGDVILLAANTLCGSEPEEQVTTSTIHLDTDYLIDQLRWQHAALLHDRLDAQLLAETIYLDPTQFFRIGESKTEVAGAWLDELEQLGLDGGFTRHFNRMQVLWYSIAHLVSPYIKAAPARAPQPRKVHLSKSLPRKRRFIPLRADARHARQLLRADPARRWTLEDLASEVHLSVSQLRRVFTEAYGKTPLTYLTMVRAEQLAYLLRETDLPVNMAMRQVGWQSRGHAAESFRQLIGMNPREYRLMRPARPMNS